MQDKPCRLTLWLLRQTYPWLHILILGVRMAIADQPQQQHLQLALQFRLYRINFAGLLELAIDLTQPEFWI